LIDDARRNAALVLQLIRLTKVSAPKHVICHINNAITVVIAVHAGGSRANIRDRLIVRPISDSARRPGGKVQIINMNRRVIKRAEGERSTRRQRVATGERRLGNFICRRSATFLPGARAIRILVMEAVSPRWVQRAARTLDI